MRNIYPFHNKESLKTKSLTEKALINPDEKMNNLKNEQKHRCDFCSSIFHDKMSLIHHIREEHLENPKKNLQCDFCDIKDEDKVMFDNHIKLNHFKCDLCDYTASDKSFKDDHIQKQHKIKQTGVDILKKNLKMPREVKIMLKLNFPQPSNILKTK